MKKLVAVLAAAALLVTAAAPPAFAGYRYKQRGFGPGSSYYGGHNYKYRPYTRYGSSYYGGHNYKYRPYTRHGYGYQYKRRHHGNYYGYYYGHGDAAVVLGVLAGAVVLGALLAQPSPAPAYAPYPARRQPALGNCLQTPGTGSWYGRPARFTGTMCYDPAGQAYVIPGSERFIGYLR